MDERKDMSYYEDFENRLETFAKWPKLAKCKPKELAEAGFVYTGTGDQTFCFSCGGVVKDWEESDDCWIQHELWFPRCKFLTSSKDLRVESNRLETFTDWKNLSMVPESLAKAGFYYSETSSDFVKCAFCNIELDYWKSGDNPMDYHAKSSPKCPLVVDRTNQQKKLPTLFSAASSDGDVCGNHDFLPKTLPETDAINLFKQMVRSSEDLKSRSETFDNCPRSLQPRVAALAEAGFYYKGVGDQVACFHCSGGLAEWNDDDDPWEQHALWFPRCDFLKTMKGQEFIDEVRSKRRLKEAESRKEEPVGEFDGTKDRVAKCKICCTNEIEVVFIPCGHLLACVTCSLLVENKCPACRQPFEATLRVFPV